LLDFEIVSIQTKKDILTLQNAKSLPLFKNLPDITNKKDPEQ